MRDLLGKLLERWAGRYYASLARQLESDKASLQSSLDAEREKTRKLAEVQAESAKHVARIQQLERELLDERHEHAKTAKQLEIAGEENRLLCAIHESDVTRRFRETALNNRDRAIAEADMPIPPEESEE
jgi:hypothetical protein